MSFIEILRDSLSSLWNSTGFVQGTWENYVMLLVSFVLFYLAIVKKFEPLLLLPIAFGMMLVNIPGGYNVLYAAEGDNGEAGGLLRQSDGVVYRGSRSRFLPFVTDDYALLQRADGGLLFLLGAGKAHGPGEPADERCLAPGIRGVVCLLEHQLTKSTGK